MLKPNSIDTHVALITSDSAGVDWQRGPFHGACLGCDYRGPAQPNERDALDDALEHKAQTDA